MCVRADVLYEWRELSFPAEAVNGFRHFGANLSSRPGEGDLTRIADCVADSLAHPLILLSSKTRIGESGAPWHFAIRVSNIKVRAWVSSSVDAAIGIGLSDTPQPKLDAGQSSLWLLTALRYQTLAPSLYPGRGLYSVSEFGGDARLTIGGDTITPAAFFKDGDTIGVACDPTSNTLQFYINDKRVWVMTDQPELYFADAAKSVLAVHPQRRRSFGKSSEFATALYL